jgi:hypothetical protein
MGSQYCKHSSAVALAGLAKAWPRPAGPDILLVALARYNTVWPGLRRMTCVCQLHTLMQIQAVSHTC